MDNPSPSLGPMLTGAGGPGMLQNLRVLEVADETAEYCGLILAGLGADVLKIEPPGGATTRGIGPFLDDRPDPEGSLYFWSYNRGKRSLTFDPKADEQRRSILALLDGADVVLDSTRGNFLKDIDLDGETLVERHSSLVYARMTPFGDIGPWKDFKGSDLVHLALGGVMMNCGYDPDPAGRYDLPPIAPQLWHAYHIAGEQLAVGIVAALLYRLRSGEGQVVSCAVHEAVSKNTELDVMSWVMRRAPLHRQTCRHAVEIPNHTPNVAHTKDGRWCVTWLVGVRDEANLIPFLDHHRMAADLKPPGADADLKARNIPGSASGDERRAHILDVNQRFVRAHTYETVPWREAQEAGLLWAPVRKPHENALDPHWLARGSFQDIEHPELGRDFRYPVSKWLSTATAWKPGRRAPLVGEHRAEWLSDRIRITASRREAAPTMKLSTRGKPFALQNIRILDFSWFLASAGGTRFLAALGAESLKVEWKENPDTRLAAMAPVGGREARMRATAPLPGVKDSDMGGQFNNKNAGKLGLSLNIRHPKGLKIAKDLVRVCDIVAEGFSPGVLERLGLGYDVMKSIRPDIIYIQQAGMGNHGLYGRMRTVGPVAAAFAGTSDMSGLAEPAMPAGWGYSYLDWMGAYGYALALLGALHHRELTGQGQWIDASQCEAGLFLTGAAILDWSANNRVWSRFGNRSPYKPAAPHGAYRCRGEDRWLAIACFTEEEWRALVAVADRPRWASEVRFATLTARLAHQDILDAEIDAWTRGLDARETMMRLQQAGVPAGLCQTAQDRCDHDPQLAALDWMTEVVGTKIGQWPVIEFPAKLSATPAYAGGPIDRGAPCYGEHNVGILTGLLGYSQSEVYDLAREGVL
jgi:crotonobetainyl-CoA:carnitine CoA-transferase CaiB-like acyl-CoA transferase